MPTGDSPLQLVTDLLHFWASDWATQCQDQPQNTQKNAAVYVKKRLFLISPFLMPLRVALHINNIQFPLTQIQRTHPQWLQEGSRATRTFSWWFCSACSCICYSESCRLNHSPSFRTGVPEVPGDLCAGHGFRDVQSCGVGASGTFSSFLLCSEQAWESGCPRHHFLLISKMDVVNTNSENCSIVKVGKDL